MAVAILSVLAAHAVEAPFAFKSRLTTVHRADRRDAAAVATADEFVLSNGTQLVCARDAPDLVRRAAADFCDYLIVSMGVNASVRAADEPSKPGLLPCVTVEVRPEAKRGYEIETSAAGVRIVASDDRMTAQAFYRLEDRMNFRRGPFLTRGIERRSPLFEHRITFAGFGNDVFPDAHLSQIAHHGFTDIEIWLDDYDVISQGPRQDINDLVARAARYGLKTLFEPRNRAFVHPDDPKADAAYREAYGKLTRYYPQAASAFFCGEVCEFPSKDPRSNGRSHFDKSPKDPDDTRPNPGWYPCSDWVDWVKKVMPIVHEGNPDFKFVFMTYNWGMQDEKARADLIAALPQGVVLVPTFEMFEKHVKRNGLVSSVADYSLAFPGPGKYFKTEAAQAKASGLELWSNCNSAGLTWDFGNIPYQPAPWQWKKRWDALKSAHEKWDLTGLRENHEYGWTPSFVAELEKEYMTEGGEDFETILRKIAVRDFGAENAEKALAAWRRWSRAADDYVPTDENQYGPCRIGPAYPYNFYGKDLQEGWAPPKDFPLDPGARFNICFFDFAKPIPGLGIAAVTLNEDDERKEIELFESQVADYREGARLMREIAATLPAGRRDEALRQAALGSYLMHACQTVVNVKLGRRAFRKGDRAEVERLAKLEYANAEAALDDVDADSRLGWLASSGYTGGRRQIEWKLRKMRELYWPEEKENPDWEDLSVNSLNRLPPRTYAMPLADEQSALTDDLEPSTPYVKSLNGIWKLSWAGNPSLRVKDFWRPDFDDSKWPTIDVPSCVEMRGFGSPGYTNVDYPHAWDPKRDVHAPTIRDRQSDKGDYNPVSSYRTSFTVPESWKGRDVILRFDGVYSAYYVWVNGKKVGYAEDSKLPSEFDITPYLNPRPSASNLLCVEVYRWCDGSFLEDQDMFRFSGIFRDVTLWAKPKDGIWDFAVRTRPVGGYERWSLELELENGGSAVLYDADNKKVGDLTPLSDSRYQLRLKPRLWSAEDPYLYTLVIRRGDDIRMKRVGFKEQKIVGNAFLVNGKAIKFKGVNRHETNPDNGRTVSREDMVRDITLMKRYNIDTVRTSHYPDHRLWYDLCDRYGVYLVAEANVEAHEPGYHEHAIGQFPEWEHAIVERNARHVAFYRNNVSVALWSLGNETGHGDCFRKARDAVKRLDPSRPVHWERGNADADVDSKMYPPLDWLERRGQLGDGLIEACGGRTPEDADDQTKGKCAFICEYAHAMGNALGNFREYWDVFYAHPSLAGGCIWDWIDQAVWKESDKVDPKTGLRERYLAYGGDWDEKPHLGPFCCNGVIGPFREVSAKLVEVGHVHRNLVVEKGEGGAFVLWNRFCFTMADEFDGSWELLEDGVTIRKGAFAVPHLAPLSRGTFAVPELDSLALDPNREYFVNFSFALREDAPWAKKGWIVARDQVPLCGKFGRSGAFEKLGNGLEVDERNDTVVVKAAGTTAVFCRKTGTLCELAMNGKTILKDAAPGVVSGPRFECRRAFVDNDCWMRDGRPQDRQTGAIPFMASGLTQLKYHARPIVVKDGAVHTIVEVTGSKSAGFTHEAVWTFGADGSVSIANVVTPHGTMPKALPRMGLSWKLDPSLEQMAYYGRGPYENYIDRNSGSFFGEWRSTVTDQYEPYVRPQDNGGKSDVRWVSFADKDGRGVRFSASEPLFVQALHYAAEDLELARHRAGMTRYRTPLEPVPEVRLNLDVRQLGLGGASCGPDPLACYQFPVERTAWRVRVEPLRGAKAP